MSASFTTLLDLIVITDLGDSCAQVDRTFDRLLGKADEYFVEVFGERENISPGLSLAILDTLTNDLYFLSDRNA